MLGLFVGTFLSATIIPLASEAMLLGALGMGMDPIIALLVATAGNSLGGITNYLIGLAANRDKLERKYKINAHKLERIEKRLVKHGFYLGLFSWLPFIGDPLTIALGFFRVQFWPLFFMMLIGRFGRYFVLTILYLSS